MTIQVTAQNELFIAENGSDTNTGTINDPLATLIGARDKARATGAQQIWIRGGRYSYDTTCSLDSQDDGLVISGYQNETVIFDGSRFINAQNFTVVTEQTQLDKLNPIAKGKVQSVQITDPNIIALLTESTAQISINDEMKTLARFPNVGFSHVNNSTINTSGEVNNTMGTYNAPVGPSFRMVESIDADKWNTEITRTKRVGTRGYVSAVWLKEDNRIHSVSGSGDVRLVDGTRYGLGNGGSSRPRRFLVYNILYELDQPGEWYFDVQTSSLYVWFDNPVDQDKTIGVWAGPQLFEINNADGITIQKMTIQNVGKGNNGKGAINVIGVSNNILVAGVRFRFIAAPLTALNFWHDVTNSSAVSCDFYDIPNCTRLYGGEMTSTSISYGNNKIENCHFTQVFSKDFYGKACGINGAGNIFRNNLIHNMNGQPLTHKGVDHLLERNEVFNVGIEEGDGGAFYTGNAIWSHGNTIKHNFVHHIMSVPALIGRAAFFSDDIDGGEFVTENVLYKGGWESIKMNKGAGHNITKNVLLDCHTAIRNGDDSGNNYQTAMNYITNNNTNSNDKNNYVGRMLKAIGIPNWQSGLTTANWSDRIEPFWTNRYSLLQPVVDQYNANNKFGAYECSFDSNLFWSNNTNTRGGSAVVTNSRDIDLSLFEQPDNLNFKFKEPRPTYAPNIPFNNIGLYQDTYRCAIPDKNVYRRNMKLRFEGQASHTNDSYSYANINTRLYYNSGEMVYETIPCADVLPEIAEANEYKFDLGTGNSKVFNDYIRVSNTTKGINFGWTDTSNLESRDRGVTSGVNDLNRDFVMSDQTRVFEARVLNGNWKVLITFGDRDEAHDNMQVKAEGQIIFNDVDSQPAAFFNQIADLDVLDGKLTLEFSDQGGSDPNWQATRIWLRRNGPALSVDNVVLDNQVQIYPNPTRGILNISYHKSIEKASVEIFDNLGRSISKSSIHNGSTINVNSFSTGLYHLKIKIGDRIFNKRFVKE
ncbi:hypothetical protein GCM10022396_35980 [Flavivirga amylovorans]